MRNVLRELRNYDQARPGFPGEHLWTAAGGFALLWWALRHRGSAGRTLAMVTGPALLYRAASGRDGLAKLLQAPGSASPQASQQQPQFRMQDQRSDSPAMLAENGADAFAAASVDSPNDAERLQRSGQFGVGAGVRVQVIEEARDDPTAKAGDERIAPGLPDLMRGA